jgi:hypothetical protein
MTIFALDLKYMLQRSGEGFLWVSISNEMLDPPVDFGNRSRLDPDSTSTLVRLHFDVSSIAPRFRSVSVVYRLVSISSGVEMDSSRPNAESGGARGEESMVQLLQEKAVLNLTGIGVDIEGEEV